MIKKCVTKDLKEKPGNLSKRQSDVEKKIAIPVQLSPLAVSMLKQDILSLSHFLAVTMLSHGILGRYTFNVDVAMELAKGNKWHIDCTSFKIMEKMSSRKSKRGVGKSRRSKIGRK
jgi:hypothetical protein